MNADNKLISFFGSVEDPCFEGYGLYEDADFSIRVAKIGKLYLNKTASYIIFIQNQEDNINISMVK